MNSPTHSLAPDAADRHADDGGALIDIVVAVDGTYAAGEALGWGARIARSSGSPLTAVHAWQPGLGDLKGGHERAAARRRRALRSWCQPARPICE